MFDAKCVDLKQLDEGVRLYRRRFPFQCAEGKQCVLFEENEEMSVKIYRTDTRNRRLNQSEDSFISYDSEGKASVGVRLERQDFSLDADTCVRLFSERYLKRSSDTEKDGNVYYTLQICDKVGAVVLFRAFCASKTVADRLFEKFCLSDVNCSNAIDFYRDARSKILREIWFCGL